MSAQKEPFLELINGADLFCSITGSRWGPPNNIIKNAIDATKNYVVQRTKETVEAAAKAVVESVRDLASNTEVSPYVNVEAKSTIGGRAALKVKGVGIANASSLEVASVSGEYDKKGANGELNYINKDKANKLSYGGNVGYIADGGTSTDKTILEGKTIRERSDVAARVGALVGVEVKAERTKDIAAQTTTIRGGVVAGGSVGLVHVVSLEIGFGMKITHKKEH